MRDETKVAPLGLGHFTFLDLSPDALIRLAARTGFAFVGLRLHPVVPGGLAYEIPAGSDAMRKTCALMRGEGVGVYDVESVVLDEAFEPRRLEPVLASAAELGAARLNVCGDDTNRARLVDNFARLSEVAALHGIGIDIECMKWRTVNSLAKCVEVVEAAGADNAGVLIDALHLDRCGGTLADLEVLAPHLVRSAQLCDAPALPPESIEAVIAEARGGRLPPGQGGLPLAALVAALPDHTTFSVELPMKSDLAPEPRARMIFEATASLFRAQQGRPASEPGSSR